MAAEDITSQLAQLDDARKLVLTDAGYYRQIIQGILPIIGTEAKPELRRWGADFLAETFANPTLPNKEKEELSLMILETLKSLVEKDGEDAGVIKSLVQCAASIYPLVFRWIIENGYDKPTWERMSAIKSRILRIWDSAAPGVRMCCIKFAQRVVMVQTPGLTSESARGNPLEISLLMVPQNHPLIPPRNLEAEASGLLDRILGVFQEPTSDAVMVDATLNSLAILIRARPPISNKILNAILNFNPLKLANSPMTPKLRVMVKSMEKTTRQLLIHLNKRDPQNPLAMKIHQHIERLMRSRNDIFDEATRKRGPPGPIDDLAKRQRVAGPELGAVTVASRLHIPPLAGKGPYTIADLFTLNSDAAGFDVSGMAEDMVIRVGMSALQRVDEDTFNQALNGIRDRYLKVTTASAQTDISLLNPDTAPLGVDEDEDDYEPDFEIAEDTEQILNKLDNAPANEAEKVADTAITTYVLPPPPALTEKETVEVGQSTVARVFGIIPTLEDPASKKNKTGINRLAASTYDRDAWITVITRLATRASAGLEDGESIVKPDPSNPLSQFSLSDAIREALYLYVVEDFRRRVDVAVAWLCEEWYNDKIQTKRYNDALPENRGTKPVLHYDKWAMKILDGIIPYLDARDKFLTRFLSEIPALNAEALERVKFLCRDPAMVQLALTTLLYLVMMRPPVRELALDAVEDVWKTYEDAKPMAAKYLTKWRPGFMEPMKDLKEHHKTLIESESAQNTASVIT